MSRYYCPFCSYRYQVYKTCSDGVLICPHCGDQLIKKPLLNFRRIIGLLASLAFLTPLLILSVFLVEDFTRDKLPINHESLGLIIVKK